MNYIIAMTTRKRLLRITKYFARFQNHSLFDYAFISIPYCIGV